MTVALSIERLRVCAAEDVPLNEGRVASVAGRAIAVFRTEAGFFALDNTCPHMGGPLADGLVADETVACPLHDRRFELASGRAVGHDCGGVAPYPVEERGGEVFVVVPIVEGAQQGPALGAPACAGGGLSDLRTADTRAAAATAYPPTGESPPGNIG